MDITPLVDTEQKIIQSYSEGSFRVSGEMYTSSILIAPHHCGIWNCGDDLSEEDFSALFDVVDDIDVLLLGTGARTEFLNPSLKQSLRDKGFHVESMDTGAACRTYNVLMTEGRRVYAALKVL